MLYIFKLLISNKTFDNLSILLVIIKVISADNLSASKLTFISNLKD